MESVKEFLKNTWSKIVLVLKRFENSPFFEQILRRYEALTPREQSHVRKTFKFLGIGVFAFILLSGPLTLLSKMKKIKTLEKLETDAFLFQAEYESKNKGYSPPAGWMPMSSSSASDLADSFNEYLARIGVPETCGTLVSLGETLNLTLKEISIKQATRILFQLEALYPRVKTSKFVWRPNSVDSKILDIEASFEFNSAAAQFAQGSNDSQNYRETLDMNTPSNSGAGNSPMSNYPSGDDMMNSPGSDFIPPPPGAENFDEFVPPDMPDDIMPGPPPPPPGFEGGGD